MNERIRELAEQAAKQVSDDLRKEDEAKWYSDLPMDQSKFQEKFAELIVEECIVKAEEEAERYLGFPNLENADMYAKVMYNYQELLKEHFGVEE